MSALRASTPALWACAQDYARVSLGQNPRRFVLRARRNLKALGFEMLMNENVIFMNNAG